MTHFVDSSVWIAYFKSGAGKWDNLIDDLLENDSICINGVVRSELLLGTRSENEFKQLATALEGLIWMDMNRSLLEKVAQNGFFLRKNGVTVPLTDLIIATQCIEADLVLIHNDKHFPLISSLLPLRLV